jgi:hypothetical protein
VVVNLELRELLLNYLCDSLAPETGGSEDVGLVDGVNGPGGIVLKSQGSGKTSDTLDLGSGVREGIISVAVLFCGLFAVTKVDTANQLANHHKVDSLDDGLLERRVCDEGVRGKGARAKVGVEIKALSESEETLLGSGVSSGPLGASYCTEEDSVCSLAGCKSFVCERCAYLSRSRSISTIERRICVTRLS